ncbi:zf-HC2 domain-containing protein [Streptomyces sp. NPDC058335]|uniref:zf-HC2 domain-containing protein n=1 Tax=Streptomyces sp. NPDC058335 TaxID=3346451 RepID=UPI00364D2CA2
MTQPRWHATDTLAARYADGTLPESDAWSLEKHLEHCTSCATRVSHAVRAGTAGAVLREVREAVLREALSQEASGSASAEASGAVLPTTPAPARAPARVREAALPAALPSVPGAARQAVRSSAAGAPAARRGPAKAPVPRPTVDQPGTTRPDAPARPTPSAPTPRARLWSSRTSGRFTVPRVSGIPGTGRFPRLGRVLWAAGPAVRGAWSVAVLVVALGAVALGYGAGVAGARPLLLALAPAVPVLGVALSYGPHADPVHEIAAASPAGGLRLLLTRTVAVLLVSLPLLTLAGLLLPGSGAPGAAAWLLPGLALTLASLALAGYVGPRAGAAVTGGGWLCAVLAPALVSPSGAPLARLAEQLSAVLAGPLAQGAWAAAAVLCAAALGARRSVYDRLP